MMANPEGFAGDSATLGQSSPLTNTTLTLHSHGWLKEMIRNGSARQGNMPAWGGTLDEQQIEELIAWFQSLWPGEVYAAWWTMEQRSRGQRPGGLL